jgi:hypothetical protein
MLNPNPLLRQIDPCLYATFGELFADMPKAPATAARMASGRRPPRFAKPGLSRRLRLISCR